MTNRSRGGTLVLRLKDFCKNCETRMKTFVVFCLLMAFVMASQAQIIVKDEAEKDEADFADMFDFNEPEEDEMANDNFFEMQSPYG